MLEFRQACQCDIRILSSIDRSRLKAAFRKEKTTIGTNVF